MTIARGDQWGESISRAKRIAVATGTLAAESNFAGRASDKLRTPAEKSGNSARAVGRLAKNPQRLRTSTANRAGGAFFLGDADEWAMGVLGFMQKPVDFERLREKLSKYISALEHPAHARFTSVTN